LFVCVLFYLSVFLLLFSTVFVSYCCCCLILQFWSCCHRFELLWLAIFGKTNNFHMILRRISKNSSILIYVYTRDYGMLSHYLSLENLDLLRKIGYVYNWFSSFFLVFTYYFFYICAISNIYLLLCLFYSEFFSFSTLPYFYFISPLLLLCFTKVFRIWIKD